MPWLIKTEPSEYDWARFVKDKRAVWDGVTNAVALKHLRSMAKGDLCLFYHTGDERRVMGVAEVIKAAYADPNAEDPKRVVVDVKVGQPLQSPVTLARIKADPAFAGWDLLRIGRLSVVPTPQSMFDRILELGK